MVAPALALAAVLLQDSRPASAPAPPPLPSEIRLGDSLKLPLGRIGDGGHVLRLDLAVAEPITILAESFDADVSVAIEDGQGNALSRDDDSGTETNAHLVWTPPSAGPVTVRVSAREGQRGTVVVRALRSSLTPTPADPELDARCYWELANDRARSRADEGRAALALERLASLERPADRAYVERSIEALRVEIGEVTASMARASSAWSSGASAAAREGVRQAWDRLEALPGFESSALVAECTWRIAELAWRVLAVEVQARAYDAARLHRERVLPRDHPDLIVAIEFTAASAFTQGDHVRARNLQEEVLAARERTLPPEHLDLAKAEANLGASLYALGNLARSRTLQERAVSGYEGALPEGHRDVIWVRSNLAATLLAVGDISGARALQERVLDVAERTLAGDDPELQWARGNLAATVRMQGDLAGARALEESVVAVLERSHPDDHPELLAARASLSALMLAQGDRRAARELIEQVHSVRERSLPKDHPELLRTRSNLAAVLVAVGDLDGARALLEAVLEACDRTLPAEHPHRILAQENLALVLIAKGDLARARELLALALDGHERTLPKRHDELLWTRARVVEVLAALGESREMEAVLSQLSREGIEQLRRHAELSPREIQASACSQQWLLDVGLARTQSVAASEALRSALFEWAETRRAHAMMDASSLRVLADPELERLRRAAHFARQLAANLVSGLDESGAAAPASVEAIADAARRRDAADRALAEALAARGEAPVVVRREALAGALARGEAAVGFLRTKRIVSGPATSVDARSVGERSLLAHVVLPGGPLLRVDLGALAPIEEAISQWRSAIEAPVERGVGGISVDAGTVRVLGERLRALILDPVLAAAPGATRLHVALDGPLHLIPVEALPLEDGVIGDQYALYHEVSFARLLRERRADVAEPRLVALGGIDFDAEGIGVDSGAASPPIAVDRSGPSGQLFGPLRQTRYEVEAIEDLFEKAWKDGTRRVLTKEEATKSAIAEAAPRARWLHVATHGYFSDASVKILGESDSAEDHGLWRSMSLEETVKGLAPFTLCGLALAGANRGRDSLGRVPGILTAEELMGLDLRHCELAVLSACETHVGLDRGASGIASLQAALHAAGVRTAITSLWKVDDERTRELMVDFYRRLWVGKEPAAVALWNAKKALRAKGAPIRDWSGWILTGDPGDDPERAPASRR